MDKDSKKKEVSEGKHYRRRNESADELFRRTRNPAAIGSQGKEMTGSASSVSSAKKKEVSEGKHYRRRNESANEMFRRLKKQGNVYGAAAKKAAPKAPARRAVGGEGYEASLKKDAMRRKLDEMQKGQKTKLSKAPTGKKKKL